MLLTRLIRRGSLLLGVGALAGGLVGIAGATTASQAATTTAPAPICTTSPMWTNATTCIQLISEGSGAYEVQATLESKVAWPSVFVTLDSPGGSTESSATSAITAGGSVSYDSNATAAVGQWCATATAVIPFFNIDVDVTGTLPCVTVPALPKPVGSASQVCVAPTEFPQFETCVDITSSGAAIAEGYSTTSGGTGFVTLTGPNGYTGSSSTTAKVAAGQLVTFTGPSPAAAGQWCATFTIDVPALTGDLDVTGKSPPCLTVS